MNNNVVDSTAETAMDNFKTPPPSNYKSRTDFLREEMLESTEWHIEISPISQSRDSDVAHELLPIDPEGGTEIFTSPTALDYLVQSVPLEGGCNATPRYDSNSLINQDTGVSNDIDRSSKNSKPTVEQSREVGESLPSCDDQPDESALLNSSGTSLSQNNDISTSSQRNGSSNVSRTGHIHPTERDGNPSGQSSGDPPLHHCNNNESCLQKPHKKEELSSAVSESSNGDLSSARRQVDESSLEFIERIRTAAHRRKVAMTRSRDSLAAKEREHLRCIAASKSKPETPEHTHSSVPKQAQVAFKQFKARPLPSTTFQKGMGGLSGVPKVDAKPTTTPLSPLLGRHKRESNTLSFERGMGGLSGVPKVDTRPPTTPFSPLLGYRRKERIQIRALDPPKQPIKGYTNKQGGKLKDTFTDRRRQKCEEKTISSFKARPVPPTTGVNGHAGQVGVPKIVKRSITIPSSPLLGHRRLMKMDQKGPRVAKGYSPATTQRLTSRKAKVTTMLGFHECTAFIPSNIIH